jgi:hypothetical protein
MRNHAREHDAAERTEGDHQAAHGRAICEEYRSD